MLETERSSVRGHAEFTEAQRGEGVCPRLMGSGRSETKIQAHGRRPALSLLHHWAGRNHSSVLLPLQTPETLWMLLSPGRQQPRGAQLSF